MGHFLTTFRQLDSLPTFLHGALNIRTLNQTTPPMGGNGSSSHHLHAEKMWAQVDRPAGTSSLMHLLLCHRTATGWSVRRQPSLMFPSFNPRNISRWWNSSKAVSPLFQPDLRSLITPHNPPPLRTRPKSSLAVLPPLWLSQLDCAIASELHRWLLQYWL